MPAPIATMRAFTLACLALLLPAFALAAPDAAEGGKLVQAQKCEICHQNKVYGPEGSIYLRKDRKVNSWAQLKSQVAVCNSMLKSSLFPEEEEHIAAFLNQKYYKLPMK